ncbi:MAG: hypothetical protein ACJA0V_001852, partial [Planctomycetota bacterium]
CMAAPAPSKHVIVSSGFASCIAWRDTVRARGSDCKVDH